MWNNIKGKVISAILEQSNLTIDIPINESKLPAITKTPKAGTVYIGEYGDIYPVIAVTDDLVFYLCPYGEIRRVEFCTKESWAYKVPSKKTSPKAS